MQADAHHSVTRLLLTAASLIAAPLVVALLPGSASAAPSAPTAAVQCPGFPPAPPPPHGGGPRGPGSGPVTPGTPSGWSPSPTSPSPGAPSTPRPTGPAPSHPTSPGGGVPAPAGAPSTGAPGPATPGGGSPTPAGPAPSTPSPSSPSSNGAVAYWALQPDTASWERWWELNRHHFLDLRAHTFVGQPQTADDDFGIGIGERRADARDLSPTEEQIREGVVPALLQVLASDPSDETINSILVALGRIGEAGDAQPGDASLATVLTGYLDHASHVVNERATIALGVLGDASAAPTLAALARDTDMGRLLVERRSVPERLRAFAAYGLGLTAERSPVPDLRRFAIHHLVGLAEDDDAPRERRVAALRALGLAALDAALLLHLLRVALHLGQALLHARLGRLQLHPRSFRRLAICSPGFLLRYLRLPLGLLFLLGLLAQALLRRQALLERLALLLHLGAVAALCLELGLPRGAFLVQLRPQHAQTDQLRGLGGSFLWL